MDWTLRLPGIGFNPSIVLLPKKLSEYFNATYVASSRYERNNINKCNNSRIVPSYKHDYSSTLISLLDKKFTPLHHSFMHAGRDLCESGRWRGCDARLLVNNEDIGISYVNFWGIETCRGHWYSKLELKKTKRGLKAHVRKIKKLVAPRNSGLFIQGDNVVELDVNGTFLNIYNQKTHRAIRLPYFNHALHTSGHPVLVNSNRLVLWTHYHESYNSKYKYGYNYRHILLSLNLSFDILDISSPFCIHQRCEDIEFFMNSFWNQKQLYGVAGINDCYGEVFKMDPDYNP